MINSDYEGKGRLALGHSEWRSLDNFSARTFFLPELSENKKAGDLRQCRTAFIDNT